MGVRVAARWFWRQEEWAATPAEVRAHKGPDAKPVFTKKLTVALMSASFAELKTELESGAFDPATTDEELIGDEGELLAQRDEFVREQVGVKLGTQVPVEAAFFAHIGWSTVRGLAWDLKAAGEALQATRCT